MTEVLSVTEPETALYDLPEDINSQTPIQNRYHNLLADINYLCNNLNEMI